MTSGSGGDPGEDEELRHGVDRLPPRLRRPATVVLVAVAGLAVAWVSTRLGEGGGTSAAPSSGVSAGPSSAMPGPSTSFSMPALPVSSGSIVFVPSGSTLPVVPVPVQPSAIPTCAPDVRCATTAALPAGVTAALRENYPGARVVSSRTITRTVAGRTSLVGRSLEAVAGARRFRIVVGPYVMGPDGFDRTNSGGTSTVSVDSASALAGQTVHLLLSEPRVARPNDLIVLRLARDPRLAAI